jgi:hypothetical protein
MTNSPQTSGYEPADSLEDVARLPDSCHKLEEDRCSNSADMTGTFLQSRHSSMKQQGSQTGLLNELF